jgi:hypothetical protein
MQSKFVFLLAFVMYANLNAQEIYFTKSGTIIFDSSTPLETIYARNNQVTSFLNIETGEINFAALMRSFKFRNALMEEHFNENFVESAKYPRAVFKGKIMNWQNIQLDKDAEQEAEIEGELTLHGATKKIAPKGIIHPRGEKIYGRCEFIVSAEDFKIQIPSVVRDKIAREVKVTVDVIYEPY